jgi:hypothetical protein
MDGPKNYLGATIFWLYNVFALVFTGITLRTLFRLQQNYGTKRRNKGAIWLFGGIAMVSFATLSSNMLNVLIQSFNAWSTDRSPEELSNLPLSIWQWSITSSLFRDFGEAIVGDSARFFWVQSALLAIINLLLHGFRGQATWCSSTMVFLLPQPDFAYFVRSESFLRCAVAFARD